MSIYEPTIEERLRKTQEELAYFMRNDLEWRHIMDAFSDIKDMDAKTILMSMKERDDCSLGKCFREAVEQYHTKWTVSATVQDWADEETDRRYLDARRRGAA